MNNKFKKEFDNLIKEDKSFILVTENYVLSNGCGNDLITYSLMGLINTVKKCTKNKRETKKHIKHYMKIALKTCNDVEFYNKEELE